MYLIIHSHYPDYSAYCSMLGRTMWTLGRSSSVHPQASHVHWFKTRADVRVRYIRYIPDPDLISLLSLGTCATLQCTHGTCFC